jgi:hypothetical protein
MATVNPIQPKSVISGGETIYPLRRIQNVRRSAVVNVQVDPREYAPGTKNQTMYK